jgi:PAS domain S-box-containing protein
MSIMRGAPVFMDQFEKNTAMMLLIRPGDGRIVDANPAATRFYGHSREHLRTMRIEEINQSPPRAVTLGMEAARRIERNYFIFPHKVASGEIRTVEVYSSPVEIDGEQLLFSIIHDITDRTIMEAALKSSEEKFSHAFHGNPDAVSITRYEDGVCVEINEGYGRLYGYATAEVIGHSTGRNDLGIWVNDEERIQLIEALKERGHVADWEAMHRRSDGSIFTAMMSASLITVEGVTCILSIIRDLTDRVKAEKELRRSEARYRSLFENMLNGLALCRMFFHGDRPTDFVYLAVNGAFEKQTGLKDVVGRKVSEVLPGLRESNPELLELYGRVALSGIPESIEVYVAPVHAWLSITAYSPEKEHFVAVFENITERKRLQLEIEQERDLLSTLMDNLPDLVYIKDATGRFRLVNLAVSKFVGAPEPKEMVGRTDRDFTPAPVADKFNADDRKVMASGRSLINMEELATNASGAARYLLTTKVPIFDKGGKVTGLVGISRDITERKEFDSRLQQTQKLESLGVLAGGIAHDFNNILMAIMGNANLAQWSLGRESPAQPQMEEIMKAGQRAADLCRQMLAYAGKGRFQVVPLDISEVIEEMKEMLMLSVSKKAALLFKLAPHPPSVLADVSQIRQVIMNLVINASEAIGERSGAITVLTGGIECDRAYLDEVWSGQLMPEGHYVFLEVTDTGAGMDDVTRSRIFEPFFTTKFTGRGLGLSAVMGIVRGHNGAIKVYTELNKGTAFKLLFPANDAPPRALTAAGGSCSEWQGHGTILLVDDEESVRKVGKLMLEQLGFCVLAASDGRSAIEQLTSHIDEVVCVVLDLSMPAMDGAEAFREMRKIKPDVKVVLSSGYNEQHAVQDFVGKGLAGFIQKPYQVSTLELKLREILGE